MRYLHAVALAALLFAACSERSSAPTDPAVPGIRGYNEVSSGAGWVRAELDDYPPGVPVTILGGGWEPGETVIMILTDDPDVQEDLVLTSVADENGSFANSDFSTSEIHVGVAFTLSAEGQSSGMTASTMFNDGTIQDASIEMREPSCTTAQGSISSGSTICAHASFSINGAGATNIQFRWKSPSGTIEEISQAAQEGSLGSGLHTGFSRTATYAPAEVGTWTVLLCQSDNTDPAPGGVAQCASGSQKASQTFEVTPAVTNHAPTSEAGGPYSGDEGEAISLDGTAEDEDDDPLITTWSYVVVSADAGASCSFDDENEVDTTVTCTDDGSYTLKLTVDDGTADPVEDTATLTVDNVDPSIDAVTDPDDNPLSSSFTVGGTVQLKVSFSDDGANDTHKAEIDCGDGSYVDVGGSGDDTSPFAASCTFATVGSKTVKVKVTDDDGGSDEETMIFSVLYDFEGFYRPVDNDGILNVAKAGQAIPLKWRLLDAFGNPVLTLSAVSVKVEGLACSLGGSADQLEEYATGSSGLQNIGDGYYQFNWKTPTSYAKSCKTLKLDLGEGAGNEHTALFQFTK